MPFNFKSYGNSVLIKDLLTEYAKSRLEEEQNNPSSPVRPPTPPQMQQQAPQAPPQSAVRPQGNNPFKNFRWFNQEPQGGERGQLGAIGAIGQGLSGYAAPFLGDNTWASRQAKTNELMFGQDTSAKAFNDWLLKQQISQTLKYTGFPMTMQEDIAATFAAIKAGANKEEAFQRLATKYGNQTTELKRIFYPKSATIEQNFIGDVEAFMSE